MIDDLMFLPIVTKMVTLGELKNDYSLQDFVDLLMQIEGFMEQIGITKGK